MIYSHRIYSTMKRRRSPKPKLRLMDFLRQFMKMK